VNDRDAMISRHVIATDVRHGNGLVESDVLRPGWRLDE
jgi:hypothetical protein